MEATRLLQQASASGSADAMLHAGAVALQSGAQAEAIAPVQQALRRHPGNARLWQLFGLLNRDRLDLATSVDAFTKAAQLMPDDAMIANGLACVSFEAGLPAVELFERAIRADPADRALLLRLTAALIDQGEGKRAIENLEEAVARYPDWSEAHATLARLKWTRGDHEHFTESFDKALAEAPRNAALWQAYAQLLSQDQLHAKALEVVERAKAILGPLPDLEGIEAVAKAELLQMDAAAAVFQRVLSHGRLDVIVAFIRFLIRVGRPQEAAAIAERNVAHVGNYLWPYLSITWRMLRDPRWEWLEGDPSFIGVYDLADSLPDLGELASCLRALHRTTDAPFDQSLRGGTQTDGNLLLPLRAELNDLRLALIRAVEQHVAQLPPPRPGHPLLVERRSPIHFSGSWSVRLAGGGRHVEHIHPAGWISSALYISLPSETDRGAGEAGWLSLGENRDLAPDLPPIRVVEPKPGRLVLFPSTMWHGTRPFEGGERLTVAFDVQQPA